jgi:hypothetical protein
MPGRGSDLREVGGLCSNTVLGEATRFTLPIDHSAECLPRFSGGGSSSGGLCSNTVLGEATRFTLPIDHSAECLPRFSGGGSSSCDPSSPL